MPTSYGNLSQLGKTAIQNADIDRVEPSATRLQNNWQNGSWLSSGNIYAKDVVAKIENGNRRYNTGNRKADRQWQLSEYVAASTVLHCMDGWSYLGKAILSDLRNDAGTSSHLAYYAELRAVMSLLASVGIGVFNKCHASLIGHEKCEHFNDGPTHRFAWLAFEEWVKSNQAKQILFDVLTVGGKPASIWLSHSGLSYGFLAHRWLNHWGIDIKRFSEDRDARNEFSYRPNTMNRISIGDAISSIESLSNYWESCEPFGAYSFEMIDRSLLRTAIRHVFKDANGRTYKQAKNIYRKYIERMLHAVSPTGMTEQRWLNFFSAEETSFYIYDLAAKNEHHSAPGYPKQIISRALLLLRIATGLTRNLLSRVPSYNRTELEFWWGKIGEARGLWRPAEPPEDFIDLWQDVQEAMDQLNEWKENTSENKSVWDLWSSPDCARSLHCLSGTERIALWGLGL
ncbi:hypothetical protein KQI63_06805 [bacterium]|nr:hypothetical protein [bacterium]